MSKVKKDTIEAKGFSIQIYTEDFKNDYISHLTVNGNNDSDILYGYKGNDTILGNDGDNTIYSWFYRFRSDLLPG